jgi:hypothetical protein
MLRIVVCEVLQPLSSCTLPEMPSWKDFVPMQVEPVIFVGSDLNESTILMNRDLSPLSITGSHSVAHPRKVCM